MNVKLKSARITLRPLSILLPGLFFLLPLLFNYWTFEKFEMTKIAGLYTILGLAFVYQAFLLLQSRTVPYARSKLFWGPVLFVFTLGISALVSIHPYTSWFGQYLRYNGSVINYLFLLFLMYVVSIQEDNRLFLRCAGALVFSGIGVSSYGVARWLGMSWSLISIPGIRATSTFGEPTNLSGFLTMLLPLGLYFILHTQRKFLKWGSSASFLLGYWCLLATYSRGAYLACMASAVVLGILLVRRGQLDILKKNIRPLVLLGISMVLITLTVAFRPQTTGAAFTDRETNTVSLRLEVWKTVPGMFLTAPVLGTGPETFQYAFSGSRPASLNTFPQWELRFDRAHNEFLNLLVTTGLVGFLLYLLIWAGALRALFPGSRAATEPQENELKPFVAASLAAFAVHVFFSFSSTTTLAMFFLLLGYLTSHDPRKVLTLPAARSSGAAILTVLAVICSLVIVFLVFVWRFVIADGIFTAGYKAMIHQENYSQATALIEDAINIFPYEERYYREFGDAFFRLAVSEAGKTNREGSDIVEQSILNASSNLDRALTSNPWQVDTHLTYARGYYDLGKYYPALNAFAGQHASEAAALEPTNVMAYELLGLSQVAEAKVSEAEQSLLKTVELKPDLLSGHLNLGIFYFDHGRYDLSYGHLTQALALEPDNQTALRYLTQLNTIFNQGEQ